MEQKYADGDNEWQQEVRRFINEQIEDHNTANQKQFDRLRDGQLELKSDIDNNHEELKENIASVLSASATAHQEIIERLKQIEERLDNR